MKKYIQPQTHIVALSLRQFLTASGDTRGLSTYKNASGVSANQGLSEDIDVDSDEDWSE